MNLPRKMAILKAVKTQLYACFVTFVSHNIVKTKRKKKKKRLKKKRKEKETRKNKKFKSGDRNYSRLFEKIS